MASTGRLASRWITATVLALLALGAVGCGKVAEKATEKLSEQACEQSGEENCDVDVSDGSVSVKTDAGDFTVGEQVEYPEGFPSYLMIADVKPISAVRTPGETGDSFAVTITSDTADDLFDTVEQQATDAGCTTGSEASATTGQTVTLTCPDGEVQLVSSAGTAAGAGLVITVTPV